MNGIEGYFAFLRERYRIMLRRASGQPAPWTEDPVLQAWRFCNVRREDDKVTAWFRENIRNPLRNEPKVFFATIAFRWFNTIKTGELLQDWLLEGRWPRQLVEKMMTDRRGNGMQLFTGAFMVNSAPGKSKHVDVLDNLDWVRRKMLDEDAFSVDIDPANCARDPWTKAEMFKHLLEIPRLGNFAAYQIVVDLQYTYLLEDASDLNTFTVAGPGCAKGLGLCFWNDQLRYRYGSKKDQEMMRALMRSVLDASLDPKHWPAEWPPFVLSDIENGFCEYMKWRSGHAGARLKRKYNGCT